MTIRLAPTALLALVLATTALLVATTAADAAPKKPYLSYSKALAAANEDAAYFCNEDCLYFAASCERWTRAMFMCVASTWSPGYSTPYIRCDSQATYKQTRYGLERKGIPGSIDCYGTSA